MNVRLPERALGDLRAQITAITSGERRYSELLRRYGVDAVNGAIRRIMDSSEAVARKNTQSIPDGTYEAESYMDDDGLEVGKRVPIRVKVIVRGDEVIAEGFDVGEGAVLFPDGGGLGRDGAVGIDVGLGKRDDEAVETVGCELRAERGKAATVVGHVVVGHGNSSKDRKLGLACAADKAVMLN
jgi:hypothetical protein